nr:transcriptional regulator, MarR family [uncultured bacterium]|tara:strand:- start:58 stop:489 length:432 start_codon:yes stop_codon:yes gene_type:complete
MKDKTIDYVLRTTWLSVQKMYNEEASNYGITMATGFTLLSVDPINGTPSTSLGPKMGMEATSLSRILKTLESMNLIERLPNPNDGRGVIIHLTKQGLKNREEVKQNVLKFNSIIKNEISEEKLKNFFEVSDCINNLISNKKIF